MDEFGRHPFHGLFYAFWLLLGCAFASMAFFEGLSYSERYVARLLGVSKNSNYLIRGTCMHLFHIHIVLVIKLLLRPCPLIHSPTFLN